MIRECRSSNFPKGTFKARTSKLGSFLNFCLPLRLRRNQARFKQFNPSGRPHIVARRCEQRQRKRMWKLHVWERALLPVRRAQLDFFCWQLSRNPPSLSPSRCGKHLEILCAPPVDRIFAALYGCKVSRTVGFGHAGSPAEKSSPGLNSRRSGGSRFGL